MRRFFAYLLVVGLCVFGPALAQDDDGGSFLERRLEEMLSGDGRDVSITGFRGALSSTATISRITFSDADGVWLRLEEIELNWTRTALLLGRIQVNTLTAAEIELARPPLPANELPSAEAPGFSLPELPVSVNIEDLAAARVILGEALMGAAAEMSVESSLRLDAGEGAGRISAQRLDGAEGDFLVEGEFSNATGVLTMNVSIQEAQGGIVASLADLPGEPALDLNIAGTGPLSDFSAELLLATDGVERIAGTLEILEAGPGGRDRRFRADLLGDIAPLLFPQYQAFFGPDISLQLSGVARDAGGTAIDDLSFKAAQLQLVGRADIGADGLPDLIDLTGRIENSDGESVLLPFPGSETWIDAADLRIDFDAARSEDWNALIDVRGFAAPGLKAENLRLEGSGSIDGSATPRVSATVEFAAASLDPGDANAGAALGENVSGRIVLDWQKGAPIDFTELSVEGETYGLDGRATLATSENGIDIETELRLSARDISVFSGLAGRSLAGEIAVDLNAEIAPMAGYYDVALRGTGTGLATGTHEVDQLLEGAAEFDIALRRDQSGSHADRLLANTDAANIDVTGSLTSERGEAKGTIELLRTDIIAPDVQGPLNLRFDASGPISQWDIQLAADGPGTNLTADLAVDLRTDVAAISGDLSAELADVAPLSPRLGRTVSGAMAVTASGALATDISSFDAKAELETTDLTIGVPHADQVLRGSAVAMITAQRAGDALLLPVFKFRSAQLLAEVSGEARTGSALTEIQEGSGKAKVTLLTSEGLVPGLPVPFTVSLDTGGTTQALDLDLTISGETVDGEADVQVDLAAETPVVSGKAALRATDIAPFSTLANRSLGGGIDISAEGDLALDLTTFDASAKAETRNLLIGQPNIDALLSGVGSAHVSARRDDGVIEVRQLDLRTAALQMSATGTTGLESNSADFDLRLADVGRWVPEFSGPATAKGKARQQRGRDWQVEVAATAPAGVQAVVKGSAAATLDSFDLSASGSLPLQAANTFIEPHALAGNARFNLRLNGPPALNNLSGQIETAGARFAAPALGIVLNGLGATINLANSRAQVESSAQVREGGQIAISGPVGLTAPFPAGLRVTISNAVLRDPNLYQTLINGAVTLDGALAGGARISGRLELGETEVRIPPGGGAGVAPSLKIEHRNEPPDVRRTRERAGLIASNEDASRAVRGGGPVYPLDLVISAPRRVFIRGRGIESEVGGELRLGGTTANVVPTGQFDLVRGRVDILTQRLSLSEGRVTLQGDFNPYIRFVALSERDGVLVRIVVEGLAEEPEITFESEPTLDEDEILARLLFGRDLSTLSAFQAVQLANAVATLAGRGGVSIVGKLRQNFGLDDFDISSNQDGDTTVSAGKYISEDVYTEISVDAKGDSTLSINLDLTDSVILKGNVSSDNSTAVGVFFERDY